MYGMKKGFDIRKYHTRRNKDGEILWQSFFCDREGFRDKKNELVRKRAPRKETRCGCLARMKIHIDNEKGDWYVSYFVDEHNHELVGEHYGAMIASNRRMTETDVAQMNTMREVGIGTGKIFGSFAGQCGGYQYIRWTKKAKDVQGVNFQQCELSKKSVNSSRYGALSDGCRVLCNLACKTEEDFTEMREKVYNECSRLRSKQHSSAMENVDNATGDQVRDPVRVRAKGRVPGITSRPKRGNHCGICREIGHNRASCPNVVRSCSRTFDNDFDEE
ncbi:hypothetical protein Lal_00031306 [Lupinus albus]|nr:hypothetical protein Lal_00031306 [Lupinus albus]